MSDLLGGAALLLMSTGVLPLLCLALVVLVLLCMVLGCARWGREVAAKRRVREATERAAAGHVAELVPAQRDGER